MDRPARLKEVPWRQVTLEWGFWLAFVTVFWTLAAYATWRQYLNAGLQPDLQRFIINETSSALSALLMLFFVRFWLTRHPIPGKPWLRVLAAHVVGFVGFASGHVALFMAFRILAYWSMGSAYAHAFPLGDWGLVRMLLYEFSKDLPVYGAMLLILGLYRYWRRPVEQPDSRRSYPDILLASSGRDEKTVRVGDIDWMQAAGNYVSLFCGEQEYLLRTTMNGLQEQLDPLQFIRVHRSYMVNIGAVAGLASNTGGQRKVRLPTGTEIPLGRAYRENLLLRLKPTAAAQRQSG